MKKRSLSEMMNTASNLVESAYEKGFDAAYPRLSWSAPDMDRSEGKQGPRDHDWGKWNLMHLVEDRIKRSYEPAGEFTAEVSVLEQWANLFEFIAKRFRTRVANIRRKEKITDEDLKKYQEKEDAFSHVQPV